MGDLFAFIKSVFLQWLALTSGVVGVVYFIIERGFKVELPWRTTRIVFMWACLFAAVFLAWQEQYTRVTQLDRELRQEQEKKHTLERELDKANTQVTQLERELTQAKQAPPLPRITSPYIDRGLTQYLSSRTSATSPSGCPMRL